MNWRIIAAAVSWLATLRTSAASRRPPPVWSQIVRKRSTIRSPSCVGVAGHHLGDKRARVDRQVQRGREQRLLAAEPVVDHGRVDAGPVRDHPHGRAVEAALGELGAGGGEQSVAGVGPARPAAAPAARGLGAGGAFGCGHGSILPCPSGDRRERRIQAAGAGSDVSRA